MRSSMYSTQFWLLCFSNFLFTASFQMIIPQLPGYLKSLGGLEYLGLIISLFTLTAGASRPFSGKLTDTIGRVPLMVIGSLVCFVCSLAYPFISTVWGFLLLRLLHGFSTGTKPTATAAYIIDVVPADRRGEAAGMLGLFTALGMSAGPALGEYTATTFSMDVMFYVSSGLAFLSIGILYNLKETLKPTQKFRFSMLNLNRSELFEKSVSKVFWVMFFVSVSSGVCITIIPLLSAEMSINKSLFFVIYTMASLVVRLLISRVSDRHGRVPVLLITNMVLAASLLFFAFTNNFLWFCIGSVLFGLAWGMNSPTITAWTADLSAAENRGKAMATMYIALEAGIGLGALFSGFLFNSFPHLLSLSFIMGCIATVVGVIILAFEMQPKLGLRS